MLIEILIAILLGCIAGVVTGLTPGLHINLVATVLFSLSSYLLGYFSVITLASFIIAMSITHTFTDFISAIYLGAPSDDTALSVLPGHRMLLKGMGYEAVKLTAIGSFFGLLVVIFLTPILLFIVPFIFSHLKNYIGWILFGVVVFTILRDRDNNKKFWNFFVFLLSGILGLIALNFPGLKDPLLPMLSGLFGVSMLIMSLNEKVVLPIQRATEMVKIRFKDTAKALASGVFSGSLVSIFPGLGPAQAGVIGMQLIGNIGTAYSLILLGSINTVSMLLSIITLFTISKARNGSIAVVQNLVGKLDFNMLILFLLVAFIAGGIATILTLNISKIISDLINKINYTQLNIFIIAFIAVIVFYFTGFIGLAVLLAAVFIGIIPAIAKVNRSNLMGCLLLPVILNYTL